MCSWSHPSWASVGSSDWQRSRRVPHLHEEREHEVLLYYGFGLNTCLTVINLSCFLPEVDLHTVGLSGLSWKPSTHRQWKLPCVLMQRCVQGYVVVHSSMSTHVFPSSFRRNPGWHLHCEEAKYEAGKATTQAAYFTHPIGRSQLEISRHWLTLNPILRSSQSWEQPLSLLLRHSLIKQFSSSEPSPQSSLWSQRSVSLTHFPLLQAYAVSLHFFSVLYGGEEMKKGTNGEKMWANEASNIARD